ncbi:MAG: hypothetical protein KDI36_18515 [Pseudomonadales bacterium]|nr:hypothetical protein [Pseudomonadales bacterium]
MNQHIIRQLHERPGYFVLAITGGGSQAIADLLAVPGASRTLLEALVPYNADSLASFLGGAPDQSCSAKTARAMAMSAFRRCQQLHQGTTPCYGVGCTAALATDRARKGENRCYVAVQSADTTLEFHLTFPRTETRPEQEQECRDLVIHAMREILGLQRWAETPIHGNFALRHGTAPLSWQQLFSSTLGSTWVNAAPPAVIFPGAFNPLHYGHREMVDIAEGMLQEKVVLEISAFNVDKPPLDFIDMTERASGLQDLAYIFTNTPTFELKSALFPGVHFVVGADTIIRIADPKYYDNDDDKRDRALRKLAEREHRFLVFGRRSGDRFTGLDDLTLPPVLKQLCLGVPESAFRADVASSELRKQQNQR